MVKTRKKVIIIVSIVLACFLLSIPTVILPISTVIVYEGVFSMRFETKDYMKMEVSDFEGLHAERSEFESDVTLTGYKYYRNEDANGVVIIAHGFGDGGHHTVGLFQGGGGVVQIDHGRMTFAAEVSFSTMTYILVMVPTACLPSRP